MPLQCHGMWYFFISFHRGHFFFSFLFISFCVVYTNKIAICIRRRDAGNIDKSSDEERMAECEHWTVWANGIEWTKLPNQHVLTAYLCQTNYFGFCLPLSVSQNLSFSSTRIRVLDFIVIKCVVSVAPWWVDSFAKSTLNNEKLKFDVILYRYIHSM